MDFVKAKLSSFSKIPSNQVGDFKHVLKMWICWLAKLMLSVCLVFTF